jgi:hypothetical protein
MKRLVIHVGMEKTGSTTIQEVLRNNAKALRARGINYPADMHHHNFTLLPLLHKDPFDMVMWKRRIKPEESKEVLSSLQLRWDRHFESHRDGIFIISSELLFQQTDLIEALHQMVHPYFDTIDLVCYIRHPNDYLSSVVQQQVKNGVRSRGIEEIFLDILDTRLQYSEVIQNWLRYFPKEHLIVRNFTRSHFKNHSLIDDFFETIGRGDITDDQLQVDRLNESIGMNSVILLAELNKRYPVIRQGRINRERGLYGRYIPMEVFTAIDEEKFKLEIRYTEAQARKINQEIRYVNQYFGRQSRFDEVAASEEVMRFPGFEDIPQDFFPELINEYHRFIDRIQFQKNEMDSVEIIKSMYAMNGRKPWRRLLNLLQFWGLGIVRKGIFDPQYYLANNPDVVKSHMNPALHYVLFGAHELRDPKEDFHVYDYLRRNPEILLRGINPAVHYERSKRKNA